MDLSGHVNRAVAKTAVGDIDVTGHVQGPVSNVLNGAKGTAEAKVKEALDVRKEVERIWNEIGSVHKIAENPPTWLRITPRKVMFAGFQYSNDTISSGLTLDLETHVYLQDTAPEVVKTPLPDLNVGGPISDDFELSVPIEISYGTLNEQLKAQLPKQPVSLPQNAFVTLPVSASGSQEVKERNAAGRKPAALMDERTMATNGIQKQIVRPVRSETSREGTGPDGATYVSPSRLHLWLRCPTAYKRRYIDGVVAPTTPSMFLGQAVHRGLEFYYRYRQDGVRLFPEYVGEHIAKTWGATVEEECIAFQSADEERQLLAKALDLVTTYLHQLPEDEPAPMAVEERLEAPLIDPRTGEDLGTPLVGILDLVLDDGTGPIIIDFKTAARSSQLDVMHELQLSCYSYLLRHMSGVSEAGLEIRSLIKTKVPKVQVERYDPRQPRHFERLFDVIRAYLDAVNSNRFHIRPGLQCGFCDYRDSVCAA